ncbi:MULTISPECIES: cytochrome c oxidase assembly protein [unclassified Paracoccus (in: a-proteobacteria)]|uniref:cytochrome c oxidase assembly protein n=2 Tax=Paracoccus TaxID=265 RepID=UPI0025F58612|nr:cytochrome c oxidase assembly protein [Paracoccus sp. UBA889]
MTPPAGLGVAFLLGASRASAHSDGAPPAPADFWSMWSLQPSVIVPLGLAVMLYAGGVRLAWARAGTGRGVRIRQVLCFAGGIAALVAALVWPLDAWGESLFSAHMAQHITLMGLAAPLLVLGQPLATMTRALPRGWQRRLAALAGTAIWRRGHDLLTATGVATALMLGVFLFWHAPPALAVALDHDLVHAVMHGSIFAAALAFWTMIARVRDRGFGVRIVALFVCFKFSLILGALLTFSGRALYPVYGSRPDAWGLTPVEDQQLAGVLMMTAAAMMYLVAALVVAAAWFASMDRTQAACNTVAAANGAGS